MTLPIPCKVRGGGRAFIKAEAEGVDLSGVVNPIQVVQTIGRDSGSTKVQAVIEGD